MRFVLYKDKRGCWRWRLKASNGRIICDSAEGYRRRADCLRGIELVRQSGSAALA